MGAEGGGRYTSGAVALLVTKDMHNAMSQSGVLPLFH